MNAAPPTRLLAIHLSSAVGRHFHFILLTAWLVLMPGRASSAAENKKLDGRTASFVAEKRAQIEKTCSDAERPVPKLVRDFFSAASRADWHTATNAAEQALRFGESVGAESNPKLWEDREFYIEESHPIDWMYPHLIPHQYIFKINRTPLSKIPLEVVQSDRQHWTKQADALIGPWLRTNTPLAEVVDFIEKTYKRKELKSFKGDRLFVKDRETQKAFGRMRAAVAGLYAWHAGNAKNDVERKRLDEEAEFAFRQAVAIGPVSPDAVPRFAYRLRDRGDVSNALRLVQLATAIDPDEEKLKPLLKEFEERSRAKRTAP